MVSWLTVLLSALGGTVGAAAVRATLWKFLGTALAVAYELRVASITRDWMDYSSLLFGAVLTIVGTIGVCAAYKTLRASQQQAAIMKTHTAVLQESVGVSRVAAKAAETNTDALINSEQAWIMVSLNWEGRGRIIESDAQGEQRAESTAMFVDCICTNHGRTPAWITEIRAKFLIQEDSPLPVEPKFADTDVVLSVASSSTP